MLKVAVAIIMYSRPELSCTLIKQSVFELFNLLSITEAEEHALSYI
jgi:hypothetical protein